MADPTDIIAARAGCAPELDAGLARHVVDGCREERLIVHDDLPEGPSITTAELDVIETFFADILDLVLSDKSGGALASLRHNGLP
jgi:hypothetical protein